MSHIQSYALVILLAILAYIYKTCPEFSKIKNIFMTTFLLTLSLIVVHTLHMTDIIKYTNTVKLMEIVLVILIAAAYMNLMSDYSNLHKHDSQARALNVIGLILIIAIFAYELKGDIEYKDMPYSKMIQSETPSPDYIKTLEFPG